MERLARIVTVLATAVAAAAALAGCGGGSDEKDETPVVSSDQRGVLSTIDALQTASREGDAARICREIFTESLATSIRKASRHSCEDEIRETFASPDAQLSVGRQIEVEGSRATATVREQDGAASTLVLVKEEGRWRIARIRPFGSR